MQSHKSSPMFLLYSTTGLGTIAWRFFDIFDLHSAAILFFIMVPVPRRSLAFNTSSTLTEVKYLSPVRPDPRVSETCHVHRYAKEGFQLLWSGFKAASRDEHLPQVCVLWRFFQKPGHLYTIWSNERASSLGGCGQHCPAKYSPPHQGWNLIDKERRGKV